MATFVRKMRLDPAEAVPHFVNLDRQVTALDASANHSAQRRSYHKPYASTDRTSAYSAARHGKTAKAAIVSRGPPHQ